MNIPKIDAITQTFSLSINGNFTSRGESAYEVAVRNGFVGTEEEWLESLKGDSVNIKGSVDTVDDLPLLPDDESDAWVVSSTGHLYVWSDGEWKDVGQFTGKDGKDGVDGVDGKDGVSPLVLQELGDSKEDSMSQDAITREIAAIRKYTGQEFNFERDSFDTIAEMKNASDADYPDGFVVFCKQTWEHFMRCSLCPDDSEYGNWINMSAVYDFYDNEPDPLNYYRPVAYGAWYEDRMAIVNELKSRAKHVVVNGIKNDVVDGVVNLGSIGQVLQASGNDTTKAMSQDATTKELAKKVDKVTGKGLSTNDYTTAEKQKLAGLSNYNDSSVVKSIKINGETKTPTAGLVDLGNVGNGYTTARGNGVVETPPNGTDSVCVVLIGESGVFFRYIFGDTTTGINVGHNGVAVANVIEANNNEFAGFYIDKVRNILRLYDKKCNLIKEISDERVTNLDLQNGGGRNGNALEFAMFNFNIFENEGVRYFDQIFKGCEFLSGINDYRFFGTYEGRKVRSQSQPTNAVDGISSYGDNGRALISTADGTVGFQNSWLGFKKDERLLLHKYSLTFKVVSGEFLENNLGHQNRVCRRVDNRELATYPLEIGVEYECYWTAFSQEGGNYAATEGTVVDFKIQERIPLQCYIMTDRTRVESDGYYTDYYNKKRYEFKNSAVGTIYSDIITNGSYFKNGQIKVSGEDIYMCVDVTKQLQKKITP